jgi:hypothetical protein
LKPSWLAKRDAQKHPVRFLEGLWQQRMRERFGVVQANFTPQQYGQMQCLRTHLGDLTRDVIEWIVEPSNWWLFCQQIRAEQKNHHVSEFPDVGVLLKRRGTALRLIRSSNCSAGTEFVQKLEQREYDRLKALLLSTYARGKPERSAKIEAAKTLADVQRVFIKFTDEDTAALQELASS